LENASVPGIYTLTVRDKAGCTYSDTTTVVFNNPLIPPSIVINPANPVCDGQSVTLQGNPAGMSAYEWTDPDGSKSYGQNRLLPSVTTANAGSYTLKVTNNGCSSTVKANLVVDGVTFNGTYGPYCINDARVTLSAVPSGGIFTIDGVVGTTFDPAAAGIGTHTIVYTYTSANGCRITRPLSIDVALKPAIITNPVMLTSCAGLGDLTLPSVTAGTAPGLTLSYWSNAAGTQAIANPKAVPAGTYYIKGTTKSGRCFDIQSVQVVVPPSLLDAVLTGSPELKCAGDLTGKIKVTVLVGTPPYSYLWSTQTAPTAIDSLTGLRAGKYSVVVTDANKCSGYFDREIKEPALMKPKFFVTDVVCKSDANGRARVTSINDNDNVNFLNSFRYSWATKPVQSAREALRLTAGYTRITITDTMKGCKTLDSVRVVARDTIAPTIICPNDIDITVQYINSTNPYKYVIDLGKPYTFDACGVDTVTNDARSDRKFRPGTTTVFWTVYDEIGLTDSCTQIVNIKEIPLIPQLITPNGDGINDKFVIDGLEQFPNTQLLIYTRSGQLVFRNDNYERPANAWDGRYSESTFSKSKIVATGVYYYLLKLGGSSSQTLKGYVYVYY
jgi:gliding motility-associated-like protein